MRSYLVRFLDLAFLHDTELRNPLALRRRLAQTPPATRSLSYFGRYFLFNAQATENCGSTTLAM